eukprot:COSAG02_NODE_434_length_22429_cov_15.013704_2_plen_157_part_00
MDRQPRVRVRSDVELGGPSGRVTAGHSALTWGYRLDTVCTHSTSTVPVSVLLGGSRLPSGRSGSSAGGLREFPEHRSTVGTHPRVTGLAAGLALQGWLIRQHAAMGQPEHGRVAPRDEDATAVDGRAGLDGAAPPLLRLAPYRWLRDTSSWEGQDP